VNVSVLRRSLVVFALLWGLGILIVSALFGRFGYGYATFLTLPLACIGSFLYLTVAKKSSNMNKSSTMERFGGWTKRNIFFISLIIGMITWPGLISILAGDEADLLNNGFPFFLIWIGASLVIFAHWSLYRYIAEKAESSGRSYIAFMVLAIFFPLIMVIVVQFFQPLGAKDGSRINSNTSAGFDVEIRKLDELLKDGLLTQDEFERKKKEILGL
jgi:uncharacterized membrane protein